MSHIQGQQPLYSAKHHPVELIKCLQAKDSTQIAVIFPNILTLHMLMSCILFSFACFLSFTHLFIYTLYLWISVKRDEKVMVVSTTVYKLRLC